MRKHSRFVLPFILTLIVAKAAFGADESPSDDSDLDISLKYVQHIHVNTYGQVVDVWENVYKKAAQAQQESSVAWYYCPHPIIDTGRMQEDFDILTKSLTSVQQTSGEIYSIPLHTSFRENDASTEIAAELTSLLGRVVKPAQVTRLPLHGYEIFTTLGTQEQILYKRPAGTHSGVARLTSFPDGVNLRLSGSYAQLADFVSNPELSARAYLSAAKVQNNSITALYEQVEKAGLTQSLGGNAGLDMGMQTSNSTAGGGFSIAGIGGGKQVDNHSVTSTVNRYVSRNFMLSQLENGNVSIAIRQYSEGNSKSIDQIRDTILTFILSRMDVLKARFQKNTDGSYDLVKEVNGDALGLHMSISQIATASKGDANFDTSTDQSFSYGGISAASKESLKISDKSDITWVPQGNILVPSTVNLYVYNQNAFQQSIQLAYSQDDIKFTQTVVESPGSQKGAADAGYIPAEVGTIIASIVPWEKQTTSFRSYYIPADGREVEHASRYFALITGLAVSDAKYPQTHIHVPDLRGLFLRGLNVFDASQSARSDAYSDPDGKDRKAGDGQMDELKQHTHGLPQHRFEGEGGSGMAGFSYDANSINAPSSFKTVGVGGAETRPKNVAVYYYVRVN